MKDENQSIEKQSKKKPHRDCMVRIRFSNIEKDALLEFFEKRGMDLTQGMRLLASDILLNKVN